MPSKEEVLASIPNVAHSAAQVKHLINGINVIQSHAPSKLRKGDVILSTSSSSEKRRPMVVVKVLQEVCLVLPLSTTEDSLNLIPSSSRFFREGFFTKQVLTVKLENAYKNFAGVYDNPRELNKAIKEMQKYLIKNFK